jgi:hypothetical protein
LLAEYYSQSGPNPVFNIAGIPEKQADTFIRKNMQCQLKYKKIKEALSLCLITFP